MSAPQTIRSSSKWLVGSNLLGQVLQFLFGIVLARLLLPADFGMIVTISIFTGVVGLVASGGMGQALVRAKDASESDYQVIFTIQLGIGLLIYAGFFIIAPWFADWFGNLLYRDLLRVSALSFLLRPFISMHNIWLQREMHFKDASIRGFIASVIASVTSIIMAWAGWGVWSLTLSGLLGGVLGYLSVFRLTPIHARLTYDRSIAGRHGSFGFKVVLNDIVSYLRSQTSNFIITTMSGAAMVGLFNKGDSLAKLPFSTISGSIYTPVMRAMAKEQDSPDKVKYLLFRMVSLLMVYTLPFYIGLWWLAKPFMVGVFGSHWAEAAIPLQILAPLGLLYCVGHPCGAVFAAMNRMGQEVVIQMVTWFIVAVGCVIGLKWGLTGVAWGIVLSQIYSTSHMYWLSSRAVQAKLSELAAAVGPALLLNGILVVALILIDVLLPAGTSEHSQLAYLVVNALVGGLVYALAFLFLPLPGLTEEALRWKQLLRIAPQAT